MKTTTVRTAVFTAFLVPALALVALSGCGQKDNAGGPKDDPKAVAEKKKGGEKKEADDGWWCKEHGVPEHDCAQCDAKVAADFKKKGDWCKEHDRPESQCFICNPKRAEKFAAAYKAKYGKEPPALPPQEKGEKK